MNSFFQHLLSRNFCCLLLCFIVCQTSSVKAEDQTADVIIVGAGLSGLTSAYYLQKAGKSVIVLESTAHIGGRIRTAQYPGYGHAEVGLEEFWQSNPVLKMFNELGIPLESSYSGFSSFYYQGHLQAYTQDNNQAFLQSVLNPQQFKDYLSWDQKMQALAKQLESKPLSKELLALKDISFADWLHDTSALSEPAQQLIRIETEPEFASSWQHISALDAIAEWQFFANGGQTPYHVLGGNQRAIEKLTQTIGSSNIQVNRQVTHISNNDNGVEVKALDTASYQQHTYHAKYVISTIPLYRLNEINFSPPLSVERKQAIDSQLGGAYFTAHVIVDQQASKYWTKDKQSVLPILTDSSLGVIYAGQSENSDYQILNLLVSGRYAEQFNIRIASVDDIQAQLLDAFEQLWPGFKPLVKHMDFYRYHPRAIALWPVGRSRFDSLSEALRQPQGRVYFAGDFTEDSHSNGAGVAALRVVSGILKQEGVEFLF